MRRIRAVADTAVVALLAVVAALALAACGSGPVGEGPAGGATTVSGSPSAAPSATPSAGDSACAHTPTGDSTVMVDWIDFLHLDGVDYIAQPGPEGVVPASRAGPVVGRIECRLSGLAFTESPRPPVDGDAAFLRVGTEVHAVAGSAPACRVTAWVGGVYRVYLAKWGLAGRSTPVACASAS